MKFAKLFFLVLISLALLSITANANTVFTLKPINLTNGWKVTGTIETDGAVGALSAANIVSWNLKVVQTTDMVWTEKDSNALNSTGVSVSGRTLRVATSPDGFTDGGTLNFSRGGGGGRIPTAAILADFTQLSVNLGYGYGGIAGWQDEIGGLNFIGLNQKNNRQYSVGSSSLAHPNVFNMRKVMLAPPPFQMTMFGKVTTDGTTGPLQPQNIVAWTITARNEDITSYSNGNSVPLSVTGVSSDGISIMVDHAGGQFVIGIGGMRPTFVTLADFTDPSMPNGFANYYMGNYGVMGVKTPLVGKKAKAYSVTK